jgi:hypothetical protein
MSSPWFLEAAIVHRLANTGRLVQREAMTTTWTLVRRAMWDNPSHGQRSSKRVSLRADVRAGKTGTVRAHASTRHAMTKRSSPAAAQPSIPGESELHPVRNAQAWYGPDLARRPEEWTHVLSAQEAAEVLAAIAAVEARGTDVVDITAADFPLPRLGAMLRRLREALLHGRGFGLLRGFPSDRLSARQRAIGFFGIGAHLGRAVSQNAKGHALGHVADLGFDYSQPTARGYQTNVRLPYHTDGADLVGLLCVRTARSGGLSSLVSSVTLYNEMLARRPDLVRVLMGPNYRDRRGEIPPGKGPWYVLPVFNAHEGRMITSYVRSAIRKAQRFDEVPRVSAELTEAMDLLDALAESPQLHLDMELRVGDIQFVCNHFILHSRTQFEDHPQPEQRRHLLRLWLSSDDGPALPRVFDDYTGLDARGRPMGLLLEGIRLNAPLVPEDGGPGASSQRLGVKTEAERS